MKIPLIVSSPLKSENNKCGFLFWNPENHYPLKSFAKKVLLLINKSQLHDGFWGKKGKEVDLKMVNFWRVNNTLDAS